MPHLQEALIRIRQESESNYGRGKKFEKLMKQAFLKHPGIYGKERFEDVLLWSEYREECRDKGLDDPGSDIGIDLVGKQRPDTSFGGGYCAIQCKNYENSKVATDGVDKFLAAAANTAVWTHRIFVSTTGHSDNAQKKLDNAGNATVITAADIDSWPIGDIRDLIERPELMDFDVKKYDPRDDQEKALAKIRKGLFPANENLGAGESSGGSRGRVIMPCGTGKSVVALWAAERNLGMGGRVLYLVPSIALMGQTMREWSLQKDPDLTHHYLSVCSDSKVGKKSEDMNLSELAIPPTTDAIKLASELKQVEPFKLTCVFSTYQSLPKVIEAQGLGAPPFDLVICDEAHRTAGQASQMESEGSGFTDVLDEHKLQAKRRLFMTATPRVYPEKAMTKASDNAIDLYSMDNEDTYGPELYNMSFGAAIDQGLLSDYQVVVVAQDETTSNTLGNSLVANLDIETSQQLLGCWDALSDPSTTGITKDRPAGVLNPRPKKEPPVRRAIAFTNTIKRSKNIKEHWLNLLKEVQTQSSDLYANYKKDKEAQSLEGDTLHLDVRHIDGEMNAFNRAQEINWLRQEDDTETTNPAVRTAKVLTNARCLTEGVDVPALDAVLFLSAKKAEIDVVQAVGRVMRTSKRKEIGYVILPVLVPEGKTASSADVVKSTAWKDVWQILRALRAHDERMDGYLGSVNLTRRKAPVVLIDNTTAAEAERNATGNFEQQAFPQELPLTVASAIVDKVSDKQQWPRWGKEVGKITQKIKTRIEAAITDPDSDGSIARLIERYNKEMRDTLRANHLTDDELLELIAQHIVTAPVLEALFDGQEFIKNNPISKELDAVYEALLGGMEGNRESQDQLGLQKELESLERFHDRMRRQLGEVTDSDARLEVLLNLYESFFKQAMPDTTKKLGIAYTPLPIVDFMLRSVDLVCREVLGLEDGIASEDLHVMDPFTGTGTYINRLLTIRRDDGTSDYLIPEKHLDRKYLGDGSGMLHELHATEFLLLAYYIAALKIEEGYRQRKKLDKYAHAEFPGLVLSDTFHEIWDSGAQMQMAGLGENEERIKDRENLSIRAIITNPPWSAGAKKSGDATTKQEYLEISERIGETYGAKLQEITEKLGVKVGAKALGNLYVLSFRWATDRLDKEKGGVVAFVHPNSLTDATSLAGMRGALRDEFTDVYVVNLLGNAKKVGEEWKKEGDKVFGVASMNGVQITIAVRNPDTDKNKPATVRYVQVPHYSKQEEKFKWLEELGDVFSDQFEEVPLNDRHDWVGITDGSYEKLLPLCQTSSSSSPVASIAHKSVLGLTTACDTYVYSFSREKLLDKVQNLIAVFNNQLHLAWEYWQANPNISVDEIADKYATAEDLHAIKWTGFLKKTFLKKLKNADEDKLEKSPEKLIFDEGKCRHVLYRPFTKLWLYEDADILTSVRSVSEIFPRGAEAEGMLLSGGSQRGITDATVATDTIPDLNAAAGGVSGYWKKTAIAIVGPSVRARPAVLATRILADLHLLDPQTRVMA